MPTDVQRASYESPTLVRLGAVASLTLASGVGSRMDTGGPNACDVGDMRNPGTC
ncbi:MAG: lasso RiPP family leader peptide-containing protein [Acidimicrobiia bacterium]